MVALGHHADAEPLIAALERNGRRLDRPWMLAIAARCRANLLAAQGDICGGRAHGARRNSRARSTADAVRARPHPADAGTTATSSALEGALARDPARGAACFRGDGHLATRRPHQGRTCPLLRRPTRDLALTPSEWRVAELAASGMTNNDVAAALFISPKTVESKPRADLSQARHQLNGPHSVAPSATDERRSRSVRHVARIIGHRPDHVGDHRPQTGR